MLPVKALLPVRKPAYVTYGLILVNVLVFLWELTIPANQLGLVFRQLAVVPCELGNHLLSPETGLDLVRSMFLHASWSHLIGNMAYLWIFGRNVEDYLGGWKFLGLYAAFGVAASFSESLVNSTLCVPMVGASGAISGVLGSYLVLYPASRVRVVIIFFRVLPRSFNAPALLVLGFWFLLQLLNGIASISPDTISGGVAFFAHIGGFIAGIIALFVYTMFHRPPETEVYLN
ncbi:MAG: rhomboid family intramembrane serine protease [Anaerolineaceae bacterium]|nr:rhomboid family intramembrane serine protease [Anaerolineaceae bacterium]